MCSIRSLYLKCFISLLGVYVTQSCNQKFFHDLSEHYHLLDQPNTPVIVVENYLLPELCQGSIPNFPQLLLLVLKNTTLSYIEPGAFSDLGQAGLNLDSNQLTTVSTGVFNGTKILSIALVKNQIATINSGAFDDMPFLKYIDLSDNKISQWNPNWFRNTLQLANVIFSANHIEELPEATLKNLRSKRRAADGTLVYTDVLFDYNKIHRIHPNAFEGHTEFDTFNLAGNMLESLPPELFSCFEKINTVDLKNNKFICLSDDELLSMRNVSIVKLRGNPLQEECSQKIRRLSKSENINVSISGDPFSFD